MNKWFNTVQAQLFFAQGALERLATLEDSETTNQSYKQTMNESMLVMQELWFAWLNEWSEYLSPKQTVKRVETFNHLADMFPTSPEVQGVVSRTSNGEHWTQAFIELETLSSQDWLARIDTQKAKADDEPSANSGMIVIARTKARRLSVLNGAEDLHEMLEGLKDFVKSVRSQHTEW